jgi:dipeptidyl aminopeptidase/acylaminoacyl peptidase
MCLKNKLLVALLTIGVCFTHVHAANDTSIFVNNVKVDIRFPERALKGCILVLPGWNFSTNDCCQKSDFCTSALQKGYCLIMPDMRKSVYHKQTFLETRADWLQYPTRTWLIDTMIPYLQNHFQILISNTKNYLFGISTGARGVALVALYTNNLFIAGAGLSGDYNQADLPNDNLMKGYYGTFEGFKIRWLGEDNPQLNAKNLKIPLYLGHGNSDKVVPVSQSINFYNELKNVNPALNHKLHVAENSGHDYNYWNSEIDAVLLFFETR